MSIQEKIWVVVDQEGYVINASNTRKTARNQKKIYEGAIADYTGFALPLQIVQYKRWKKVR